MGSITTVKIEYGEAPPVRRRGLIRICAADEAIERDAMYFYNLGISLRTSIRIAVARYDNVIDSFRSVIIPGVDRNSIIRRLSLQLHRGLRETNEYRQQFTNQYDGDGSITIERMPKAGSNDPVVERIRASIYRKGKTRPIT
jgi:hypothetical protein